eukprot:gene8281-9847_t
MINWLFSRHIKVAGLELHPNCCNIVLKNYLQLFGAHVRHVCPHEDYNILLGNRTFATQSSLIAEHCHNLTSASLCTYKAYPGSILAILKNNDCLEKLDFNGGLYGEDSLSQYPTLTLPHLKQLKWHMKYGFDESLVTLARAAPHLQQLSLSYHSTHFDYDHGRVNVLGQLIMRPELKGGYTAEEIYQLVTLKKVGTETLSCHIDAFHSATIVHVYTHCDHLLGMIATHCHNMQILAMLYDEYSNMRVWLSVDQLMTIAAYAPQLRIVVSEKKKYRDFKEEVDYSAVRKAFPKLVFTDNVAAAHFDLLDMPV